MDDKNTNNPNTPENKPGWENSLYIENVDGCWKSMTRISESRANFFVLRSPEGIMLAQRVGGVLHVNAPPGTQWLNYFEIPDPPPPLLDIVCTMGEDGLVDAADAVNPNPTNEG